MPQFFIQKGHGAHVWDEDGNRYIDYLLGSGPMVLGHAHPEVKEAVTQQLELGTTFFANNRSGVELAEVICDAMACADQLRFVSTGSEADMYAIRLARAHTGRTKILKFEGGYHGMSGEGLMSLAPQQLQNYPQAVPDSSGIPESVRESVVVGAFNDAELAASLIDEYAEDLAAVIVEPLQRLIPPAPGFLETLRRETEKRGVVLIFDEVVTGFRLAWGGGQELYGVTPDVCTLGKIIGGGFPLAAIAGKAEIMQHFDKTKAHERGFLFQIGTLSGNPVAAVAGLKTLEVLRREGSYERIRASGERIQNALVEAFDQTGTPVQIVGDPVCFDAVFTERQPVNYRDILASDMDRMKAFSAALRSLGVLKPEGKFYVSLALTDEDIAETITAIHQAADIVART